MGRSKLIALWGLCGLLGSCVEDSVSIRLDCIIPPEDDCTYLADSTLCSGQGSLNLDVRGSYFAMYRVTNGLSTRRRTSPPLGEVNGFNVDGFDVTLLDPAGNELNLGALENPYFVPATGYAEPAGGATPAGGVMIAPAYVMALARRFDTTSSFRSFLMEVRVRATTDADRKIKSTAITYPVYLGRASSSPDDAQCTTSEGTVCLLGQDRDANSCDPALEAAADG